MSPWQRDISYFTTRGDTFKALDTSHVFCTGFITSTEAGSSDSFSPYGRKIVSILDRIKALMYREQDTF